MMSKKYTFRVENVVGSSSLKFSEESLSEQEDLSDIEKNIATIREKMSELSNKKEELKEKVEDKKDKLDEVDDGNHASSAGDAIEIQNELEEKENELQETRKKIEELDEDLRRSRMRRIARETDGLREITKSKSALHLKKEQDLPSITIYKSGKFIIRSPNKTKLRKASEWLIDDLGHILHNPEEILESVEIDNVLGVGELTELNSEIQTDKLSEILNETGITKQDGTQFPSLVYNSDDYNCTFQIFSSGKIVTVGSNSVDEAKEDLEKFTNKIYNTEEDWTREHETQLSEGLAKLVVKAEMEDIKNS